MNLIGQSIEHKIFGSGIISDLSDGIVTISFQNNEKRFIYPDAFHSFLILKDKKAHKHVQDHIKEQENAALEAMQAKQAEQNLKNKLLNFQITAKSHAVFDIPPDEIEQVIKAGQVSTGKYLSGSSKGMPRIAERIMPNSVCLLTSCPAGGKEQDRNIAGAFMVKEDFFGEDAQDGIIQGHSNHRILIPKECQLPFWKYFGQSAPPRWGNTAYKYCSGDTLNKILANLTELLSASELEETAISFYRYFCRINRLRPLIKLEEENED